MENLCALFEGIVLVNLAFGLEFSSWTAWEFLIVVGKHQAKTLKSKAFLPPFSTNPCSLIFFIDRDILNGTVFAFSLHGIVSTLVIGP